MAPKDAYGPNSPTKISYLDGRPNTLSLRRIQLVLEPHSGSPRTLHFDQDVITLGTSDTNDVALRDDTVSRHHCRIVQDDRHTVLIDLGSTNGTHINGVRVREAYLSPGMMIAVGNTQLRYHPVVEQIPVTPSEQEAFGDIVGKSVKMREIFGILEKIAPTSATVVIEGETGTGKEVVARTLHNMSTRRDGPFVVFDCGAVPESLIESELFGHEKGSFTGAVMSRKGLFEMAQGGTIFLDELGELALDLQPKLLRVLEQREVRRVGANNSIPIDVRVVAATNRKLEDEVQRGRFRQDLFYRLSVVRLFLPKLADRKEDIPLLINHFLRKLPFNRRHDDPSRRKIERLEKSALDALTAYPWPGNVRELVNVIERACSMSDGSCIRPADLPGYLFSAASSPSPQSSPSLHTSPHLAPPSFDDSSGEPKKRWSELPARHDL